VSDGGRWVRAAIAMVALMGTALGAATLAAPAVASAAAPSIVGDSDSFAALPVQDWAAHLGTQGYSVKLVGSGEDEDQQVLEAYASGLVNFAVSPIPYGAGTGVPAPPPESYQYVPLLTESLCLTYDIGGPFEPPVPSLNLNAATVLGLFTGTITSWDDPALAALNPGVALPDTAVVPVVRADPAPESWLLEEYLRATEWSGWDAYTAAIGARSTPNPVYPTGKAGAYQGYFEQLNGSEALTEYVKDTAGTIGYVDPDYARLNNLPCASVSNARGDFTQPTVAAVADALRSTRLQANTAPVPASIFNARNPGAYPLSWFVMAITPLSGSAPVGKVLGAFLKYAVCGGQSGIVSVDNGALPAPLVKDAFVGILRTTGAADPGRLTARNCPNPNLTGGASTG
jgi:ABC-type phosphate transport system substrate-binding protein